MCGNMSEKHAPATKPFWIGWCVVTWHVVGYVRHHCQINDDDDDDDDNDDDDDDDDDDIWPELQKYCVDRQLLRSEKLVKKYYVRKM